MAFGIYKPDQGYWTRVISALSVGILALSGAGWMWNQLGAVRIGSVDPTFVQAIGASSIFIVLAGMAYWIYGSNRKTVEFFIATEGELKKVNWSTRREIVGSTWVVIIIAFAISTLLFVVDIFFKEFFGAIGVLATGSEILDWIKSLLAG